jgi:hypothetical protein
VATVIALAVGVALRLWRPDLAQANFDESNVASLVAAWKYEGALPLAGTVGSYGFRAAQGWPWLAALGVRFSDDPYALIGAGLFGGVAGLIATWWVARRWLGAWGGAAAALTYGTMFWCVLLGRGVWLPVFLQAPLALFLDALLLLVVKRRPWALALACGWFGLLVSLHFTTLAYVLVLVPAAIAARAVLRPRHVLSAAVICALPLLPFVVYETNPAVRFEELRGLLGLSNAAAVVDLETISSTIQIDTTFGAAGLGGHAAAEVASWLGRWTNLSYLGPILAAAGLVVGIVFRPRGPVAWIIAAWSLAPIVAYIHHSAPIIFHYMYLQFPALAVSTGMLAAWAAASRLAWVRVGVASAIGVCAAASALSMVVLLHGLETLDMSAGYGIPVGYTRAAGEAARAALPAGGVVLVGNDPHSSEVQRFGVGYGVPSRTFEDCRGVPNEANAVYLLASEQTPGAQALERAGAPLLARIARPGGDAYRVYGALPAGTPSLSVAPSAGNQVCDDRVVWDAAQ